MVLQWRDVPKALGMGRDDEVEEDQYLGQAQDESGQVDEKSPVLRDQAQPAALVDQVWVPREAAIGLVAE